VKDQVDVNRSHLIRKYVAEKLTKNISIEVKYLYAVETLVRLRGE
jgi:hypothetical protein